MLETARWRMELASQIVVVYAAILIMSFPKDRQADVHPNQRRALDGRHL